MKTKFILIYLLSMSLVYSGQLNVTASIPDLGDMANRIGGDKVKVTTLATGREDLHAVPVRPGFLPVLNRTDILITLGLDAEHAWLPALAAEARNNKIMEGQKRWVEVNTGIPVLNIPEVLDRSEGEQHPEGNPHYNIGPHCGKFMAHNITDALIEADAENREYYLNNLNKYLIEIDSAISALKKNGSSLIRIAVIDYHPDMSYLCDYYGMEIIGHIEPKAGISPTASHLRELESLGKQINVKLIIHNQSQSPKIPQKLGKALNCPVIQIANAVGAKKEITTWLELQKYNQRMLVESLKESK